MKIRKILAIGMSVVLLTGVLCACGGDEQTGVQESAQPEVENTETPETEPVDAEVSEAVESETVEADPYDGLKLYQSQSGVSLYMSEGYTEMQLEGVACSFEGNNSAMSFTTETFETFEAVGISTDISLEEYANLVIQANGMSGEPLTDEYGNVYIIYSQNIEGSDITYYAFFGRGSDAYWTCNFMCETAETASYEENFKLWASSLQFP